MPDQPEDADMTKPEPRTGDDPLSPDDPALTPDAAFEIRRVSWPAVVALLIAGIALASAYLYLHRAS